MAECEKLAKCPFFYDRMGNMPGMAALYKKKFCQGDNTDCARYRVSKAGIPMPSDLFPNMLDTALKIIEESSGK